MNAIKTTSRRQLINRLIFVIIALPVLIGSVYGVELLATGFEGTTNLPAGWSQVQVSGNATWKIQTGSGDASHWPASVNYPANAHSGTNNATLYLSSSDNRTRLITPTFDSSGHLNVTLTFWHTQWATNAGQDTLKILYSSDAGTTWTERAYYDSMVTSWTQRTVFLGAPSANSRIAFEGVANYGFGACLDDVQVTGDPAGSLSEVSVTATDADAAETGPDGGTWTISRSGSTSGSLTVYFNITGTATIVDDYSVSVNESITLGPGQASRTVTLATVDDSVYDELDETAVLTLTPNPSYGIGGAYEDTITIADNDDASVRVLIIGSSRDSTDSSQITGWSSSPFDAASTRDQLQNILSGAGLGGVNVTLIDRSAEGHSDDVFSLAQWFHYPYPEDVETTTRWPNLRGEKDFAWDYVVLIGDPYTMEKMPGVYAQGVAAVGEEVSKGSAETVLLMPWPASGSSSSVAHYKDVVYRAGRTGGYNVAPAGLAWDDDGSPTNATRCAFISAASIYSRIWGESSSNSSYNYNNTLANSVHAVVTSNVGAAQYSGKFSFKNPFLMLGDPRRNVHYSEKGTSTEEDYKQAAGRAMVRCRVSYNSGSYNDKYSSNTPEDDGRGWPTGNAMPIAWNHGRKFAEPQKEYVINPAYWQLGMGFSYQWNTWSETVATANDKQISRMFYNDMDLAGYMVEAVNEGNGQGDSARSIPWRFLWALIHQEYPTLNPLRDGSGPHVNTDLRESVGTYMYTLYSGRCPLDPEPSPMTASWFAQKVGYETAWRLGNCSSRAPGFKVMPSSATKLTVTPSTTESMTVQFILPPQNDVTVQISSSDTSAAVVGPQTLVFTPSNYNIPQTVTVTGVTGSPASAPFTIQFSTVSDDDVYNGLSDSWAYTTTRTATTVTHVENGTTQYSTPKNFAVTINLNAPGATAANTTFAGPNHGTLSWLGSDVVYTPDTDYVGRDGFAYWSENSGTVTTGCSDISVIDGYPAGSVRVEATDAEATEAGTTTGTWSIIRAGSTSGNLVVYFSIDGTAVPSDYSISNSSPVTIPNGQSSVTITLTPVDDSDREYPETVTLTITADAAYTAITNPATITIVDDDNTVPTAYAGADKTVTLGGAVPWTPADVSPNLWLDGADYDGNGSTYSDNTLLTTDWQDKSGNGNHYALVSGPTYQVAELGGNDTVEILSGGFDGPTGAGMPASGEWTVIFAAKKLASDSDGRVFQGHTGNYLLGYWGTYKRSLFLNNAPRGHNTLAATATGVTDFEIICFVRGPDGGINFYVNGDLAYTFSNTDSSSGIIWDFLQGGYSGERAHCQIGEFITVHSTVSDTERQDLEGYLAWKWGLEGNLPVGHDHKDGAPGGSAVSVPLSDATVTDPDVGDTLAGTWTVISTPPGGTATFDNANLINATVTLNAVGEYVLRLTGTDGTDTHYDDVIITVGTGGNSIADVALPAGISLYGYTGEDPVNATAAFQTLIDNSQLSLVRWVDPANGSIKELYYTSFPAPGWVNEIGDLTLGQGYVVKTTTACTLSINGNKSTASANHNLPAGYSLIGFNKETPLDAQTVLQPLIDAGKLEIVRWVDPSNGSIKELYYTTFPAPGWINEIGNMSEGQGYIIKLNAPHSGFALP